MFGRSCWAFGQKGVEPAATWGVGGGLYQQLQLLKWPHEADSKERTTCFYKNLYILVQLWFGVLSIFNYINCNMSWKYDSHFMGFHWMGTCRQVVKVLEILPPLQPQEHCQHAYEVIVSKAWGKRRKKGLGGQRGKGATNNLWLLWDTEISLQWVNLFGKDLKMRNVCGFDKSPTLHLFTYFRKSQNVL